MASDCPLHVLFFPLMSPGHFIPMVDMARIFANRGVRSTFVTTPCNASNISTIPNLHLVTIPFPSPELTGLAPGQENLGSIPSSLLNAFVAALNHLRAPLESILGEHKPDCIISDSLFPWTADLAVQFNIPRIIFHGAGAFPLFVTTHIFQHFPLDPSKESFLMDGLPHKIRLYREGLPDLFSNIPVLMTMAEAEAKSYGVVVNTYRDMEPSYVDFYKGAKKSWCVGPVSLCNKKEEDKAMRGEAPAAAKERIMSWLDSKAEASVVYLCFGSLCHFNAAQLKEIALGLESSGQNFLWVVRKEAEGDAVEEKEWMPEGYEERVGDRGMVLRGWAPQALLLGHGSVGWFVTHCGWNSLQEAACAGMPLVTWPLFHEQFINAELAVEVMEFGTRMWEGFRKSDFRDGKAIVMAEEIAEVLKKVTGGEEKFEEMRRKAKKYAEAANRAVEEGGSSYEDVTDFLQDMKARRNKE